MRPDSALRVTKAAATSTPSAQLTCGKPSRARIGSSHAFVLFSTSSASIGRKPTRRLFMSSGLFRFGASATGRAHILSGARAATGRWRPLRLRAFPHRGTALSPITVAPSRRICPMWEQLATQSTCPVPSLFATRGAPSSRQEALGHREEGEERPKVRRWRYETHGKSCGTRFSAVRQSDAAEGAVGHPRCPLGSGTSVCLRAVRFTAQQRGHDRWDAQGRDALGDDA